MAIKETPTKLRDYYKLMLRAFTIKKNETIKAIKEDTEKLEVLYNEVVANKDKYIDFKIKLDDYKEFVDNTYINGKFYKVAKGAYLNRNNDYELVSDLYNLYNLARFQKTIYDANKKVSFYDRLLSLTFDKYADIIRAYYTEVHKQLILNGYGYLFGHDIGWICINRVLVRNTKPHIDYKATKEREAQLKKDGIRIYNKEEAEWCEERGIEYKAEDKRVFQNIEHCYEIPLLDSHLPDGQKLKLTITDYRHNKLRGKSNDQLSQECNNDIEKICELTVDLKTKLSMCDKIDKILYTKFIRNETQKSFTVTKTDRKNRQRL